MQLSYGPIIGEPLWFDFSVDDSIVTRIGYSERTSGPKKFHQKQIGDLEKKLAEWVQRTWEQWREALDVDALDKLWAEMKSEKK